MIFCQRGKWVCLSAEKVVPISGRGWRAEEKGERKLRRARGGGGKKKEKKFWHLRPGVIPLDHLLKTTKANQGANGKSNSKRIARAFVIRVAYVMSSFMQFGHKEKENSLKRCLKRTFAAHCLPRQNASQSRFT